MQYTNSSSMNNIIAKYKKICGCTHQISLQKFNPLSAVQITMAINKFECWMINFLSIRFLNPIYRMSFAEESQLQGVPYCCIHNKKRIDLMTWCKCPLECAASTREGGGLKLPLTIFMLRSNDSFMTFLREQCGKIFQISRPIIVFSPRSKITLSVTIPLLIINRLK